MPSSGETSVSARNGSKKKKKKKKNMFLRIYYTVAQMLMNNFE